MFGKRRNPPAGAVVDREPISEVFPASVWEGRTGEMLDSLGVRRDDPGNRAPSEAGARARLADNLRAQAVLTDKVNAGLRAQGVTAPGRMEPFCVFSASLWDGAIGYWLVEALDMLPYEDWNRFYLPDTDALAFVMDTFPHPGPIEDDAVRIARDRIQLAHQALMSVHQSVGQRLNRTPPDMEALTEFMEVKRRITLDLKGLAAKMRDFIVQQRLASFRASNPVHQAHSSWDADGRWRRSGPAA